MATLLQAAPGFPQHWGLGLGTETHLDVQNHARTELGAQRERLLPNLQQTRAPRIPTKTPVLRQPCSHGSP